MVNETHLSWNFFSSFYIKLIASYETSLCFTLWNFNRYGALRHTIALYNRVTRDAMVLWLTV